MSNNGDFDYEQTDHIHGHLREVTLKPISLPDIQNLILPSFVVKAMAHDNKKHSGS